jgi:hypothetical protein
MARQKLTYLGISVYPEQRERLEIRTQRRKISMSALLREVVEFYLDKIPDDDLPPDMTVEESREVIANTQRELKRLQRQLAAAERVQKRIELEQSTQLNKEVA